MSPSQPNDTTPLLVAIFFSSILILLDLVGFLGWYKNIRSYISYPITTVGHNLNTIFLQTVSSTLHGTTLKNENLALRQKVIELESLVISYTDQVNKLPALQKLYETTRAVSYKKTENAEVISTRADQVAGKLLLNKGSSSGIKLGMPVVVANFYLGYISSVTTFDSISTIFSIPGQEFICYIQAKKITGIARVGINGVELGDLLANEKVALHDVVSIKRDGFPYFYTLGNIMRIPANNGSAERKAVVESPIDISTLMYVTIIKE